MAAGLRAAGSSTSEAQRADAFALEPFAQDHALAQRAAQGDARAQKQLALRLIARIRRAAHALTGGAAEADDAAQLALIEVLRALLGYSGGTSLEAWADRLAARSVVRFARALRARSASPDDGSEAPDQDHVPAERKSRTLEELIRQLDSTVREALLLRELFAFDMVQAAQLMRVSAPVLREQLARARRSVYLRAGGAAAEDGSLPAPLVSWFALRDSETRPGSDLERARAEQAALEADPEVKRMQRELRTLAQFLDSGRFGRLAARDKKLVEGALAAVRVSSAGPERTSLETPRDSAAEPFEASAGNWVNPVALSLCALLVVGSFAALLTRKPGSTPSAKGAIPSESGGKVVKPTVEAMSTAHTVDPRARLQRGGVPLSEGATMREGDIVAASSRPGCFVLSPPADVCLAGGSEARIAALKLTSREVELLSGRAVVSVEKVSEGVPFAIVIGELRAEVTDADFGVEIDSDSVVVRALRGPLVVSADGETRVMAPAQSAIYRWHQHKLEIVPQLIEKARRDWDLLAVRMGSGGGAVRASRSESTAVPLARGGLPPADAPEEDALAAESEPVAEPEPALEAPSIDLARASAEELLAFANELSRERRWREATDVYERLSRRFPQNPLAREAWVLKGELLAERLQQPAEALAAFNRYLSLGGGALDVRARYGRIVALRLLNRSDDEQAAVKQFLNLHRGTPQARVLLSTADVGESDTLER